MENMHIENTKSFVQEFEEALDPLPGKDKGHP